ncbi:MAG: hypothetical protein EOM73_11560, partial [Bacteroidia bacterium]|nr:hypothetical protein [Bacteroidia bacterium]
MSEFGMLGMLAEIEDEMGVNAPASLKQKVAKAKTVAASIKPTTSGVATAQSRAEMLDKFALLPKEIQAGLSSGKLQMTDHVIYATKSVSGATTVKLFEDSDSRMVGVCNISKAKMEKNEYFLLSG